VFERAVGNVTVSGDRPGDVRTTDPSVEAVVLTKSPTVPHTVAETAAVDVASGAVVARATVGVGAGVAVAAATGETVADGATATVGLQPASAATSRVRSARVR
jgi:hypothetical protein